MKRIITISREFGSGGRTIGKGVAEKLGIPCYDHEVIEQLVERSGFAADYVKSQSEYAPNGSLFVNALNAGNFHGLSTRISCGRCSGRLSRNLVKKRTVSLSADVQITF